MMLRVVEPCRIYPGHHSASIPEWVEFKVTGLFLASHSDRLTS